MWRAGVSSPQHRSQQRLHGVKTGEWEKSLHRKTGQAPFPRMGTFGVKSSVGS